MRPSTHLNLVAACALLALLTAGCGSSGSGAAALDIEPEAITLFVGQAALLRVPANTVPVGSAASWVSNNPQIAVVQVDDALSAFVVGVGQGTTTVTATVGNRVGSATVTVLANAGR